MSIARAVADWRALLGEPAVSTNGGALASWTRDTSAFSQHVCAVLRPRGRDVIPALIGIANRERVPLYPVSTGNNWGYGTANPPWPGCAIVDLSALREICFDPETGLATVEPGVTQRQMHQYLAALQLPFMVPVTGAGPGCSLMGNALERGFGLTPHADHFGAVTSLEAVLADRRIYRSALADLGAAASHAFKWGIGPYLDGLFSQGNFGVVTRITIALAPRPERIAAMLFGVEEDAALEQAVCAVRDLLRENGALLGNVNLMNRARMEAMNAGAAVAGSRPVPAWTGAAAIYGPAAVVKAAAAGCRNRIERAATWVRVLDIGKVERMHAVLGKLPFGLLSAMRERIAALLPGLQLLSGVPSTMALRLAYAEGRQITGSRPPDPARDGCGLIWYSPLVPLNSGRVREYVRMVEQTTAGYGLRAPITLTALSDRAFASTVPLLFDRADAQRADAAEHCYRELFEEGCAAGFVPYRVGAQHMDLAVKQESVFWQMARQIKSAVDPEGILAPGRYSLAASTAGATAREGGLLAYGA